MHVWDVICNIGVVGSEMISGSCGGRDWRFGVERSALAVEKKMVAWPESNDLVRWQSGGRRVPVTVESVGSVWRRAKSWRAATVGRKVHSLEEINRDYCSLRVLRRLVCSDPAAGPRCVEV